MCNEKQNKSVRLTLRQAQGERGKENVFNRSSESFYPYPFALSSSKGQPNGFKNNNTLEQTTCFPASPVVIVNNTEQEIPYMFEQSFYQPFPHATNKYHYNKVVMHAQLHH